MGQETFTERGVIKELKHRFFMRYELGPNTRAVRKVKNDCAYNPRSCFIVPNQSFGVFSRV